MMRGGEVGAGVGDFTDFVQLNNQSEVPFTRKEHLFFVNWVEAVKVCGMVRQ